MVNILFAGQKFAHCATLLLVGLILAATLSACAEASTATPSANFNFAVSPGPTTRSNPTTRAPDTVKAVATSTVVPSPTSKTAPSPTVAPLVPTATLPAPTSASTNQVDENIDETARGQNPTLPDLSQLPRVNGVPKIPVLNTSLQPAQPAPVIKANYGEGDRPRVGIQMGHFESELLPDEQSSLRGSTGGSGGGIREVVLNEDIARRVAALLSAKGITVDVLPATVPIAYAADAFVAIHADASSSGGPSGYKLARSRFSAIPQTDDDLVNAIFESYGKATGLSVSDAITRNMTGYYAFNSRRRVHAVSRITPSAIIEMGYLTNASDRTFLINRKDTVAQGIATGILNFLQNRPPLEKREKPQERAPAVEAQLENTPVYAEGGGALIAYVSKGQRFEYFEDKGNYYSVFIPVLRQTGYIRKTDATRGTAPR